MYCVWISNWNRMLRLYAHNISPVADIFCSKFYGSIGRGIPGRKRERQRDLGRTTKHPYFPFGSNFRFYYRYIVMLEVKSRTLISMADRRQAITKVETPKIYICVSIRRNTEEHTYSIRACLWWDILNGCPIASYICHFNITTRVIKRQLISDPIPITHRFISAFYDYPSYLCVYVWGGRGVCVVCVCACDYIIRFLLLCDKYRKCRNL